MSPRRVPSSAQPPGAQPIVALTRDGWSNPSGLQRPGLQRVAYFLENGTLRREYWNVLDPTLASTTAKRELMEHVKTFTVRYLDVNHQWQRSVAAGLGMPGVRHRGSGPAPPPARGRDHHRHRGLGQDRAHHRDRHVNARAARSASPRALRAAARISAASRSWSRCCSWHWAPSWPPPSPTRAP